MSNDKNIGSVTFEGESAGYQNALGMYKIAADGTITDVQILFANASLKGSGGDLKAGSSSVDVEVNAGDNVAFFVVPNGYAKSGMASILSSEKGTFKFVTESGAAGNVNGGEPLKLVYVAPNGKTTEVKGEYGTTVFHSVDDGSKGLNGDGLNHVKVTETAEGLKIGFEDLKSGGDKDFDDAVFTFRTSEAAKEAAAAPVEIGKELLIDGSFEQALVGADDWGHQAQVGGWKSSTEVEVWGKGYNGVTATDGNKVAELDYDTRQSNIYQDVKTEAGAEYTFSFDYMKRPDSKSGSDTIEVYWNGKLVGSVDPTKSVWAKSDFKVVGTGGTDRIEFREPAGDNDSYGGLIDNASLKKSGLSTTERAAAAEAAAKEAAEKAAAEAAAKEAAEKAAAEAAAKEAAEKAAAEAAAKEAAEKAAAEAAAKEAAEKAAAEAAAKEAAEKAGVDIHIGDNSTNKLAGWDNHDSIVFGEGGKDDLVGLGGDDRMHGGGGDDTMSGDDGNDTMFGASTLGGKVDMTKFRITEDTTAKVTFNYESAGYHNALGLYKIAADGSISGVQILFANASLKGSGGDLVSGVSAVDVDMKAGERIGFFVVPDGFSQSGMAALLSDKNASFKFVDGSGKAGNINAGSELKLVHVAANGTQTLVKSAYGNSVFHSADDGSKGLNGDGMKHVTGSVNNLDGTVKVGFEDLKGGGDKDFDDSVFTVSIGTTNSALLAKEATKTTRSTDNDKMSGGTGNDVMFGMADNDQMDGGAGDDQMWGNAGADRMRGGEGNDDVRGGKDDDVLWGEAGDDKLAGNTGNDTIHGGDGSDTLTGDSGNDVLSGGRGNDIESGGSGDDTFLGGAGDDVISGGSGFDTLDYRHLNSSITVDLSKHTVTGNGSGSDNVSGIEALFGSAKNDIIAGDKNANAIDGSGGNDVIRGAAGSDTLTGGAGNDTFVWSLKDVGAGKGVDHIRDFSQGDKLNLHELLKGQKFSSISDVVRVNDTAEGSKVSVKVGGAMVDVTVLDGVHGTSAIELLKAGMILT